MSRRIGLRRLFLSVPMALIALGALAFSLPALSGVDPAAATLRARFAEPATDPETLAKVRQELGLDDGVWTRFARFLVDAAQGDFGLSFVSRLPVGPLAWRAFVVSLQLLVPTVVLAVVVGVALGATASMATGLLRRVCTALCVMGAAVPYHVLGPLSVLVFGVWLQVMPTGGWGTLRHVVLPVLVLAIAPAITIAEVVRAEMIQALHANFIRTARAKGLSRFRIFRHAFAVSRHGALALAGVMTGGLLSGAVVVETIFSVPGLGRFIVEAVRAADLTSLQAGLLLAGSFAVMVGALFEALAVLLDPRLRVAR
jgi:peptide/nickel transport system permease protein